MGGDSVTTVADLAERFVGKRAVAQPRRLHVDVTWACQSTIHSEMVIRTSDYIAIADKMIFECGYRA